MTIQEQLNDFSGCQIIGLDTRVNVPLRGGKSNPLQGKVTKVSTGNLVMVFKSSAGYRNMVNRRLKKQWEEHMLTEDLFQAIDRESSGSGGFTPGPRQWGQRIPDTPFVEHKGKQYLECIFLRPGQSRYFIDGVEVDFSEIQPMLPTKTEGEQGGLRDKVIIRTFAMESIIKVRKKKTEFAV